MNLRQAAQQALEALERVMSHGQAVQEAKDVLRAALTEPEQIEDVVVYGSAWSKGGKRIDPMSVYKEPEQEPVAWMVYTDGGASAYVTDNPNDLIGAYRALPLYTSAPTPRKPLSEEEIVRLMVGEDRVQLLYAKPGDPYFSEFAEGAIRELVESGRAIERAHGIGEQHGS